MTYAQWKRSQNLPFLRDNGARYIDKELIRVFTERAEFYKEQIVRETEQYIGFIRGYEEQIDYASRLKAEFIMEGIEDGTSKILTKNKPYDAQKRTSK